MSLLDYDRLQAVRRRFSFSMRDLLVGVAIVAVLVTAYGNLGWLAIGPGLLAMSIGLMHWGTRRQHQVATLVGALLVVPAMLVTLAALFAYLVLGIGPRFIRDRWPDIVHEIAAISNDDLSGAKVNGLGGDLLDDDYVWRQRVPPDKVDEVVAKYAWFELRRNEAPDWYFDFFPRYWGPSPSATCRYFADAPPDMLPRGGAETILMYDPESGFLYGWQHWDF